MAKAHRFGVVEGSGAIRRVSIQPQQAGPVACPDTVTLLEDLLARARRGEVQGLAAVALGADGGYDLHATGAALNTPTLTLGTLSKLQHDIAAAID